MRGMLFGWLLCLLNVNEGEVMKLVNVKNGLVVIEFIGDDIRFGDPLLEASMTHQGILIPEALRENFGGKKVILIDDPDFKRAFVEIYYTLYVHNKDLYQWK